MSNLSEERIASIQRGIEQSRAGRTRPASEVLADLGIDDDEATP